MSESSRTLTSRRRLEAWSKMDTVKQTQSGWASCHVTQTHPQSNPANSESLNSTTNEVLERRKGPPRSLRNANAE